MIETHPMRATIQIPCHNSDLHLIEIDSSASLATHKLIVFGLWKTRHFEFLYFRLCLGRAGIFGPTRTKISGLNFKSGTRSGFKLRFFSGSKISGPGRPLPSFLEIPSIFVNYTHNLCAKAGTDNLKKWVENRNNIHNLKFYLRVHGSKYI